MKLVSVIMSVYNENEEWLKISIESILNQSYKEIEFLILLDNPANINAKKIIEGYRDRDSRIKFIENEYNIGLTQSLNKGLKFCHGDYIARMDADDISVLNRIEKQVKYLEINTDIGVVASNIIFIDENSNNINGSDYMNMNENDFKKIILKLNPFPHPTWLFKREVLLELNEYREIKAAEDYDFICRALINNVRFAVIEERLLCYRVRQNSITKTNKLRQVYETERIKKVYCRSLLANKNYMDEMNVFEFDEKKFNRFSIALAYLNDGKILLKQKNIIKACLNFGKSIFICPERIILKVYIKLVNIRI